jgi:hypothetical protein
MSENAIGAAVRFLLAAQDGDGAWRDFNLRPGRADAWTTAYIGLKLIEVRPRDGELRHALTRAARFLSHAASPHGGWSYNRTCPPDADSTALALLFLKGMGMTVPMKEVAALARFQVGTGGFATYLFGGSDHGWNKPHVEVTATALRALLEFLPRDHFRIHDGVAWLQKQLRAEEPPKPYWWLSPSYLAVELERLRAAGVEVQAPVRYDEDGSVFAQALCLSLETMRHAPPPLLAKKLAMIERLQCRDGSWPASPILRVTDPRASEPAGPLAADDRRLFTTATVVAAMAGINAD